MSSAMTPKCTWQELLDGIRELFSRDAVNVDELRKLMMSYTSMEEDWQQYVIFDKYRYTRNLVDRGNGKYNLIVLCWGENQISSIHDHPNAHCMVKMLDGSLTETGFAWPAENCPQVGEMQNTGSSNVFRNDVCYINDSMGLHSMANSSMTNKAVSLHLYCPPFEKCSTFDKKTGKQQQCTVTFWSENGERTHHVHKPQEMTSITDTRN